MRVLVIEDDDSLGSHVAKGLRAEGYTVDWVTDGAEGLMMITMADFDVIIVDRMLPNLDGLSLIKAARATGVGAAVLFLTALGGIDDRVEGLDAGGDDYLVKPFAFSELLARVRALARRPVTENQTSVVTVGDLKVDVLQRKITRAGKAIQLQPREYRLLEVLLNNKGRIVTRSMLLEQVWDFNFDPRTSVVETLISRLRAKIDKPFDTELIHTERGLGYCLDDPR